MAGEQFFDSLDDEVQFQVSNNFQGGVVSNARAALLKDNQLSAATNVDLNLAGEVVTRRGSIALGGIVGGSSNAAGIQGMFWYSTSTNEYLVAVNKHKLYNWNGTTWTNFGAAWTSTDDNAMTQFDQVSNKLYFCNGTVNLHSWDGTTLVDLGNAANNQPPATPRMCVSHTNRLVVVGAAANRNVIYFSQFSDGTVYDKAKWSITIGDANDEITAIHSWTGFNLLVFMRHSVWVINCDPSLQLQDVDGTVQFFEVKPIHNQLGCIAGNSVAQVGNDVFFLSQHGVYSVGRLIASGSATEIGPDLSYPIHDKIERLNLAAASSAAAIGFGNKYMLSYPVDASSSNNAQEVWNDSLKCWSGTWTGWNASCFAYCSPTGGNLMRFGTEDGGGLVKEWLDYTQLSNETAATFQDSGVNIPTSLTTKAYTFGGLSNLKTPYCFRMDFYKSLASGNLTVQFDRDNPVTIATFIGSGGTGITFPLTFPILFPAIKTLPNNVALQNKEQFSEVKFTLATTSAKLNLVSCAAGAWEDTLDNRGVWIGGVNA
jgi:hypothetical protein